MYEIKINHQDMASKIKHQDMASNEKYSMAMALFKAVNDEPIIEDMFPNYTSTDSELTKDQEYLKAVNDESIIEDMFPNYTSTDSKLTKDQEYLKDLHAIIYDIKGV